MSWFSDIGDFIGGSSTGGVGGWLNTNSSWLKPIAELGVGAVKQNQVDNTQSQYLDYLKSKENQNYDDSVAQINAYNAQLEASNAASAARAAAARGTEANRMKASKKANKVSQSTYKDLLKMYKPYRDTADALLPQMTQTYQNSLGMQNNMMNYLAQPNQMAKLDASGPAFRVKIPLPDSVRLK